MNPIAVQQPTQAYVRLTDSSGASSIPLTVISNRPTGEAPATISVTAARVGTSSTYLAPLTLLPEHYSASTALRTTLEASPQLPVALGDDPVAANDSSGSERANSTTRFNGTVRLRFMKRATNANDSDGCMTNPVDSCLTANPLDPSNPGVAQETYIDPTNNYAEVARLKIDVINPWFPIEVERTGGAVRINETANNVYFQGGITQRQLLYDGFYGSSNLTAGSPGNVVQLQNGQATLKLASVAEAKFSSTNIDGNGNPALLPSPYFATISGTLIGSGLTSLPLTITQWVDEASYARTRSAPNLGWLYDGSGPIPHDCADWLEMKAGDFYATASPSNAPEADQVIRQVTHTKLTWTPPAGHENDEAFVRPASTVVEWVPQWAWLRYDIDRTYRKAYYGLFSTEAAKDSFKDTASHEARHCWQNVLPTLGSYPDADNDAVFGGVPAGSEELLDAPYAGRCLGGLSNPESDFAGDAGGAATFDPEDRVIPVRERNAVRFAAAVIGLPSQAYPGTGNSMGCATYSQTVEKTSDPGTIQGHYQFLDERNHLEDVAGAAVMVENAPAGTACGATSGWNAVGIVFTASNGWIGLPVSGLPLGTIRLTLVTPKECPSLVQVPPQCFTVP